MPPSAPLPTDAELKILRVLWSDGPSTVRDVLEALDEDHSYTTVLKHLQIMHEKGLVERDESGRAHVYTSVTDESGTQQKLVEDLLDRAFSGSAETLVMQALSAQSVTQEELDKIRSLIDELDSRSNDGDNS